MFEAVIMALIYLCLLAAVAWLVIWVLGQIGVPLPAQVIKIFWVIVGLVAILVLWRMLGSHLALPR